MSLKYYITGFIAGGIYQFVFSEIVAFCCFVHSEDLGLNWVRLQVSGSKNAQCLTEFQSSV